MNNASSSGRERERKKKERIIKVSTFFRNTFSNHNFVARENRREKESKNNGEAWLGDFRSAPTNFIRGQRGKRRMSNPSAPFNESLSHSSSLPFSLTLASNGRKRTKNIGTDWRPAKRQRERSNTGFRRPSKWTSGGGRGKKNKEK